MDDSTITIELSENDYLDGSLFAAKWSSKRRFIMFFLALIYLALGLFLVFYAPHDFFIFGCALLGGVFGAFFSGAFGRFVLRPRRLRAHFSKRKALHRKVMLSWGERGVTFENENGHSLAPWEDFLKFRENDGFILLYTSRITFILIPKRFFKESGQLNDFMTLVRGRVGLQEAAQ